MIPNLLHIKIVPEFFNKSENLHYYEYRYSEMSVLITGGAGFIGSHLADKLVNSSKVSIVDNLSSGRLENLGKNRDKIDFTKLDLTYKFEVASLMNNYETIYHFAANPEVNASKATPDQHFRQNIEVTYNILEAMRRSDTSELVFTSTSTVYGENVEIPTPEDYGPLKPISLYGATKLADEALISAYANMYGLKATIYRLANVIGPRSNHGVIYDFIHKLRKTPNKLEVLGDGSQSKSYIYISDCVDGILKGRNHNKSVEIYNIGTNSQTKVLEIAGIVKTEMNHPTAEITTTGGVDGGRGWKGDVKTMQLDTTKLEKTGWKPVYTSTEAVAKTVQEMLSYL